MTTEIRPIEPAEAADYLQVLPFANGFPNWEPAPAAWYSGPEAWPPPSGPPTPEQLQAWTADVLAEDFRTQAAFVDGRLVGGSGMLSLGITVPGGRSIPMGGVTATGVLPTHRRRGLLRAMMQAMFRDALDRGEALAGLSASEGTIYGRFGFSPATMRTRWELDRSEARMAPLEKPSGTVELVHADDVRAAWPELHERVRRTRVGELTPFQDQWSGLSDDAPGPDGPLRYLVHRDSAGMTDGIAHFRIPWAARIENTGTLVVEAIEALTDDAYRALWAVLIDVDLTRTIIAAGRPLDEPLRWLLQNPRAMRITRQSDNLWIRILDLPKALQARAYESAVQLRIGIEQDPMCPDNVGVWQLIADQDGAACAHTDAGPDLTMTINALGSLYLGGMSAALLAHARQIREHRAGAISELSRALRTDPPPHNSFGF